MCQGRLHLWWGRAAIFQAFRQQAQLRWSDVWGFVSQQDHAFIILFAEFKTRRRWWEGRSGADAPIPWMWTAWWGLVQSWNLQVQEGCWLLGNKSCPRPLPLSLCPSPLGSAPGCGVPIHHKSRGFCLLNLSRVHFPWTATDLHHAGLISFPLKPVLLKHTVLPSLFSQLQS